jgi:hypothetical protein
LNGLVPNDNSTLGKFQYVQTLLGYNNPDSTAKARDFTVNTIIAFITLKYGQASSEVQAQYAAQYEQVKAELLCFVGLFSIPRGNTPKVVVTTKPVNGIWFPEGFCPQETCSGINVALDVLTACTSPGVPTGCTPAPFGTSARPLWELSQGHVVWRHPEPESEPGRDRRHLCAHRNRRIVDQLRVLHQDDGTSNTAGLTILDGVAIPTELDNLLLCDSWLGANNNIQESVPRSMFARMVQPSGRPVAPGEGRGDQDDAGRPWDRRHDAYVQPLRPRRHHAQCHRHRWYEDNLLPGQSGRTGLCAALTADPNATLADSVDHKQTSGLPGVYVKTGLGTAIPGATVTFTMTNPVTDPYKNTISNASVCDGSGTTQTQIVATTDATGFAALGCANFGNTVGFKNLQATINPATATGVAGAGISEVTVTSCDPTCGTPGSSTTLNWLVQTTPGNAAKLALNQSSWSAAAGAALSPQPVVTVRDRLNNVVTTSSAVVHRDGNRAERRHRRLDRARPQQPHRTDCDLRHTHRTWDWWNGGELGTFVRLRNADAGHSDRLDLSRLGDGHQDIDAARTDRCPDVHLHHGPGPRRERQPRAPSDREGRVRQSGKWRTLTWSPLLGSNGSALNVGGATTTGAGGTAQATSWTLGDGANELDANITALLTGTPAQFFASTPTGVANFSCLSGTASGIWFRGARRGRPPRR